MRTSSKNSAPASAAEVPPGTVQRRRASVEDAVQEHEESEMMKANERAAESFTKMQRAMTRNSGQKETRAARLSSTLRSFRVLLPVGGLLVVAATGLLALLITWTVSLHSTEVAVAKLRTETISTSKAARIEVASSEPAGDGLIVRLNPQPCALMAHATSILNAAPAVASRILSVTNGVQELSMRGALGPVGESLIGCCSPRSHEAQSLGDFPEVRKYLYENLQTSPHLGLNYVGTSAGSILIYSKTSDMQHIDATNARGGEGNFKVTLSDMTTNYSYHSYFSNDWTDGGFVLALSSRCDAELPRLSARSYAQSLTTAQLCAQALATVTLPDGRTNVPMTYVNSALRPANCSINLVSGIAEFNSMASTNYAHADPEQRALCQERTWMQRPTIFRPTCTHDWPCRQGYFETLVQETWLSCRQNPACTSSTNLFDARQFSASTSPYNATQRSWWRGAVANGDLDGAHCARFPNCRSQPGWSTVYLSNALQELVLPSVFPLYVDGTDTVRAVITLGLGLRFLDALVQTAVQEVATEAQGFIVDLNPSPSKLGNLLASSPMGLSTVGGTAGLAAVEAADQAGGTARLIQSVSRKLVAYGGGWRGLPTTTQISFVSGESEYLIQAKRIEDSYGLEWLVVFVVPSSIFLGDLENARTTVFSIVISATVLFALVLFLFTGSLTSSFERLRRNMTKVARMELDDTLFKRSRSVVTEVCSMEESFGSMASTLKALWSKEQERLITLERSKSQRTLRQVKEAQVGAKQLTHPMCLLCATTFINKGVLTPYETLRDAGLLVVLDTMEQVEAFKKHKTVIFLSHQWLGWGIPDPQNVHFRAMCHAVRQVMRRMHLGDNYDLDQVYVWVDYSSIAQEHRGMQMLAVSSLPVYCSVAHAFVAVVPEAEHTNKKVTCDVASYNQRGWCRAEMLSKVCGSGVENMYLLDSVHGQLRPVATESMANINLHVFEGEFSCCALKHKNCETCDKELLTLPVLGLYSLMLRQSESFFFSMLLNKFEAEEDRWFPRSFTFEREGADGHVDTEQRELFGDLRKEMLKFTKLQKAHEPDIFSRAQAPASRVFADGSPVFVKRSSGEESFGVVESYNAEKHVYRVVLASQQVKPCRDHMMRPAPQAAPAPPQEPNLSGRVAGFFSPSDSKPSKGGAVKPRVCPGCGDPVSVKNQGDRFCSQCGTSMGVGLHQDSMDA